MRFLRKCIGKPVKRYMRRVLARIPSSVRARVCVCNRRAPIILSAMNYVRTSRHVGISTGRTKLFVHFALISTEQLVSSHIFRGPAGIEKRANYELIFPQKKKKIPLFSPERNTESFRDFAVLLIHRRFAFLSRAVSQFLIHL